MRLRTALRSRRTWFRFASSTRSAKYAQDYVTRFGFEAERHPAYLTMALGAGSVTAWQMARAYAVFANGGFLVQPYFIHKIVDRAQRAGARRTAARGRRSAARARPAQRLHHGPHDAGRDAPELRRVRGGRSDLAGKTGTTNEFVDLVRRLPAGVGRHIVGGVRPAATLGKNQTGGVVALPIWLRLHGACCPTTRRWRAPCRRAWYRADHGALRRAEDDSGVFYREAAPPDVLTPPPPPAAPTPLPERSTPT